VITHTRTHASEPDSGTSSDGVYAGYALEQLVTNQTEMPVFKGFRSRLASQVTIKELSRPPPPTNDTPWGVPPALYRRDSHAILFENLENQMFIQERVDALKSEVDQLTEQLREKSKFAASEDVEGRGDPIQAAREMLELKEILKLKKLAFNHATQQLHETEKRNQEDARRQTREQIQERIVRLEQIAKKSRSAIKRLASYINELMSLEEEIFQLGKTASDWDHGAYRHLRRGDLTYAFLVNALATEIPLKNRQLAYWPDQSEASERAEPGVAYYGYISERIAYEETNHA
jgi:hypothetical protein